MRFLTSNHERRYIDLRNSKAKARRTSFQIKTRTTVNFNSTTDTRYTYITMSRQKYLSAAINVLHNYDVWRVYRCLSTGRINKALRDANTARWL